MKIAILIDGGHLRIAARKAGVTYDPDLIERVAKASALQDESVFRILYYDCAPFSGSVKLPVSGGIKSFDGNDNWLKDLVQKELFAVRRGVLKFRGFKLKKAPSIGRELSDADFKPDFEQKGVDMRIGLDMSNLASGRIVDRIALITADTDCIPAMKQARIQGLQIILVRLKNQHIAPELIWHADFQREISFAG